MTNILLLVIFAVMFIGCTSEEDANRALNAQGFTDVSYTGYDFFSCGRDDFYHTGFIATNTQGNRVEGVACSGVFFKNTTLRF